MITEADPGQKAAVGPRDHFTTTIFRVADRPPASTR
jgi:hypothetical protein